MPQGRVTRTLDISQEPHPGAWEKNHHFLASSHGRNERRLWSVIALTLVMMVAEIAGGYLWGSMALLADGWHMASHAGALGISALAYMIARKHVHNPRFTLGTGKVGDLAAFASAVALGLVALLIALESIGRLIEPQPIRYGEAISVAILGLAVNLVSAWLLHGGHEHGHSHGHHHGHDHHDHHHDHGHEHDHAHHGHEGGEHHKDHNITAAYVHVLADALTSVLAIAALVVGMTVGWTWLDALIGLLGAVVIARWSFSLMRSTAGILLDMTPDPHLVERARAALETEADHVTDLHIWRVGPGHLAAMATIVSTNPQPACAYHDRLKALGPQAHMLSHVTVEVHSCA
ncbi:CDF family Co(II)/Ni(II) efflux transporter DmeF [Pedomonas mirosovicensis]|uniref:CDF family Co(II)/Ni(II) efflux transporter DmeF n=1 Tax=Pedomonas mirosovicensis TaxID=2908641 RepID=UPI002169EE96|nr:CDF family Co(II)/Ni(II) efflux transporter DmeF [Pedomonas mirosovicensis]MCH8684087.1 CDF family Co(II)/Ni(II) efflux transporter DmeF [Pedomonas mirosovicensis]